MPVRFEWDEEKARANLKKHKVGFDEASTVFRDPLAYIFDDEGHSTEDEKRAIIIWAKHILSTTAFCWLLLSNAS